MRSQIFETIIIKTISFIFWMWSFGVSGFIEKIVFLVFPQAYFDFRTMIYAFLGNVTYGVFELLMKERELTNGIEGAKPLTLRELVFIGIRPVAAAIFCFVFHALLQTIGKAYNIEFFNALTGIEGTIILGFIVGFSFEFISGRGLFNWMSKALFSLLDGIKKALLKWLTNMVDKND